LLRTRNLNYSFSFVKSCLSKNQKKCLFTICVEAFSQKEREQSYCFVFENANILIDFFNFISAKKNIATAMKLKNLFDVKLITISKHERA